MRRHYVPPPAVVGGGNQSIALPKLSLAATALAPSVTIANVGPVWQSSIPQQDLTVGVPYTLDLDTYCVGAASYSVLSGSLPAGLTLDPATGVISGTPTTVETDTPTFRASDASTSAAADWVARSTGAGVLWAHNFDTVSEIDKFRWHASEGALSGGNLPNLSQAISDGYSQVGRLTYDTTDGFAGGGCINILVPAGSNSDKIAWWRPLSALATPGNGKATSDPGANGTTQRRTWSPVNNVDATFNFQKGYFGNATEQALTGTTYAGNTNVWDGTDFYLQFRCKFSASRFRTDQPQGKLLYIDILGGSGEQEVLLRANQKMSWNQNTGAFDIYTSFGNHLQSYLGSNQGDTGSTTAREPGGVFASTCTFGPGVQTCFEWPADTWVTVLVHVIPGQNAYRTSGFDPGDKATWTNAPKDAGLQVWVAPQGQTTYTKIWDKTDYIWIYDTQRNPAGFNAVAVRAYINSFDGSHASVDFTQKYTQFILSKNTIACPQA